MLNEQHVVTLLTVLVDEVRCRLPSALIGSNFTTRNVVLVSSNDHYIRYCTGLLRDVTDLFLPRMTRNPNGKYREKNLGCSMYRHIFENTPTVSFPESFSKSILNQSTNIHR